MPHNLQWQPGEHGKGFLIKPDEMYARKRPEILGAKPLIWTWPTKDLRPTHPQMKVRTVHESPMGMMPEPSSYFHIDPQGGLYVYGHGRELTPEDHAAIREADPRLRPAGEIPKMESDSYGHANRILELLGGKKLSQWIETRWREIRS